MRKRWRALSLQLPDVNGYLGLLEVSKRALQVLEKRIGLSCNHVDYFGTGADGRGGLAVCSQAQSLWSITRARTCRFLRAGVISSSRSQMIRGVANILGIHFRRLPGVNVQHQRATEELAGGEANW